MEGRVDLGDLLHTEITPT